MMRWRKYGYKLPKLICYDTSSNLVLATGASTTWVLAELTAHNNCVNKTTLDRDVMQRQQGE